MTPRSPVAIVMLGNDGADTLATVDPDVFDNPVVPEYLQEFLADPRNLLAVAIDDGIVVGMASGLLYNHPDKPRQLFVNEVGVAGGYRRRGIGTRLVRRLLEHGRAHGCTEAWVATEESNRPARALYEALDGTEDADRAVVYTWRLENARDQQKD